MWKPNDSSKKNFITYNGLLPDNLYRYRSISEKNIDYIVDFEILEEAIYLAGLHELNDPDEGRFKIIFPKSRREIHSYFKRTLAKQFEKLTEKEILEISKNYTNETISLGYRPPERAIKYTRSVIEKIVRVACFTTDPTNYLMWATYAKFHRENEKSIEHAGICIEYSCDESWRSTTLHPVKYSKDIPEINIIANDESEMIRAFYAKSPEWEAEAEWRVAYTIHAQPPFPENFTANSKIKLEGAVKAVIFGSRTPESIINKIQDRVLSKNSKIEFKKITSDILTLERKIISL